MFNVIRRSKALLLAVVLAVTLLGIGSLALPRVAPLPLYAQGGVTGFANLRITNFYRAQPRTRLLVSMNGTVNATGTYQPISATVGSAVATSGANITVKPAGSWLTLINTGGQTITFTETGTLKSAGNIALGALDSATLWSDGTNWYQVAASNN